MTSEQQFPTTLHILLFLQISGIASLTLPRFPLALAVFLAAPTVIEVADLEAVELRLPEALVDLVVDEASPAGGEFREPTCGGYLASRARKCVAQSPHGYSRANNWMYVRSAADSSSVGCSGNRAIIVWNSFHDARPSSALRTRVARAGVSKSVPA